jgi:two-component system cell cycle sensor histidine kinase/response regulator CckA
MGGNGTTGNQIAGDQVAGEQLAEDLLRARQRIVELEEAEARRLQAEQALRQSREQYRTLVEGTSQPITYCSLDGTIVFINQVGATNLGAPREMIIGSSVFDLLPDIADRTKDRIRQIISSQQGQTFEDWVALDSGSHCFESRFEPVRSSAGVVEGVQIVSLDVTQRKQAEEALKESEALWRTLTESSPDFVMLVDLEGRIRVANRTISELTIEAIIGTCHLDFLTGDSRAAAEACFAQVLASKQSGSYQVTYQTGPDQSRHFETRVGPVIQDGEVTSFVMTATDVTERREAEEERARLETQILHSQKLDSLGLFASGIAHDFNNLLMGIIGNADLALHALPRYSPERERIGVVVKTAQRCAELANQMLAYSGKGTLTRETIDLRILLHDMGDLLRASIADGTELEVDLAEGLPAIHADASQIHQVVMNLVINASEALGGEQGVVSLSLLEENCDANCRCRSDFPDAGDWPSGPSVLLQVSDTGCGMDDETRRRLFDPFFTTKFAGRGLGMAAVHGILRAHQAGIVVASAPKKGTTFKVYFPCADQEAETNVTTAAETWRPTGTVLVVDDEPIVRDVVEGALKQLGFQVLTAADGLEAVAMFQAHAEDLICVVLDLEMPKMGGGQALGEIRKLREDMPILLTSGYPEEAAAERFASTGRVGFIQKPYGVDALEEQMLLLLKPSAEPAGGRE